MTNHTDIHDFNTALLAIKARINGDFDHPALTAYGPLHVDRMADVLYIAETALKGNHLDEHRMVR